MKYHVRIGESQHEVVLDGDGVHVDGVTVAARLTEITGTPLRAVTIGDEVHRAVVRKGTGRGHYVLWLDGYRFEVEALDERARVISELSKVSAAAAGPAPLSAPMPGLIVRVTVDVGARVQAGQGLIVMEAMKMENELRALSAGTVKAVHVSAGTVVEKGAILVEME
jgi:acetyl/propionyl-CoA carboxylase alpha subunit